MKQIKASLLLCSILLLFSCNGKESSIIDASDKPLLPDKEYEDSSSAFKEDQGIKKDHLIEAEAALFDGVSVLNNAPLDSICKAQSYFFDLSFSDSLIIRNISNSKNRYIFKFNSDQSILSDLQVRVASAYKSGFIERNLCDMFDIYLNGKKLDIDVLVPKGSKEEIKGNNNYTAMKTVSFPLPIRQNDNTLIFQAGDYVSNLDYINIRSSAKITLDEPHYWKDESSISISLPSVLTEGKLNLKCEKHQIENSFILPVLNKENGYLYDEKEESFSFLFEGEKFTFFKDGRYQVPANINIEE